MKKDNPFTFETTVKVQDKFRNVIFLLRFVDKTTEEIDEILKKENLEQIPVTVYEALLQFRTLEDRLNKIEEYRDKLTNNVDYLDEQIMYLKKDIEEISKYENKSIHPTIYQYNSKDKT